MSNFLTPEVLEVALSLMEELDSPRSLTVAILIRNEEWVQLMQLECNPSNYCDSESYLRATAATDFLRKLDSNVPGLDPENAAFQKWLEAEKQCYLTNCRLNEILDFGTLNQSPCPERILDFIEDVRKNLLWLIGSGPNPTFEGRFGPGATMSDVSSRTTVLHKMSSTPTLTPGAWPYLIPWTGTKWATAVAARGDDLSFVRGNSYFTVNKTALTKRSCGKEPSLNGYYQLGLGREMRIRLKRRGIDLDDGQDVHRRVACLASINGESCTIDLSSASDNLCKALVRLTPPKWEAHLTALRSPFTRVKGKWWRLEKFSSMGNGYTFELETAIFTALCISAMGGLDKATPGKNLWVYGDDIICPTAHAQDVIMTLKFFGFKTNVKKTFTTGSFRESCGGDFYAGDPVRAHFLKELPYEPQHYIALANGIRRLASNLSLCSGVPVHLRRTWFRCLDYIPSAIRQCRGPEVLGDLTIHDAEDRWSTRWRANGIRYLRVYRPASFRGVSFARFDPDIQIAAALYGVVLNPQRPKGGWPEGYDNRMAVSRDGVAGYKVGWLPFS